MADATPSQSSLDATPSLSSLDAPSSALSSSEIHFPAEIVAEFIYQSRESSGGKDATHIRTSLRLVSRMWKVEVETMFVREILPLTWFVPTTSMNDLSFQGFTSDAQDLARFKTYPLFRSSREVPDYEGWSPSNIWKLFVVEIRGRYNDTLRTAINERFSFDRETGEIIVDWRLLIGAAMWERVEQAQQATSLNADAKAHLEANYHLFLTHSLERGLDAGAHDDYIKNVLGPFLTGAFRSEQLSRRSRIVRQAWRLDGASDSLNMEEMIQLLFGNVSGSENAEENRMMHELDEMNHEASHYESDFDGYRDVEVDDYWDEYGYYEKNDDWSGDDI